MVGNQVNDSKIIRIAVFYDGNFFYHVSNYYLYHHERKARISINGLHRFLINETSILEERPERHCRIVDAHYFRGRVTAHEAQSRDILYGERIFDDILMKENVITHYLPLAPDGEKGIDVWLALEAYEYAIYRRFDVCILIASDGDYLPLIRKINTLGTRVMVLGWDFEYVDRDGKQRTTRTSQLILNEANYPMLMDTIIDDRSRKNDHLIDNLFVREKPKRFNDHSISQPKTGFIKKLLDGFGFIVSDDLKVELYFKIDQIIGCPKNLREGATVLFELGENRQGPCAKQVTILQNPNQEGVLEFTPR